MTGLQKQKCHIHLEREAAVRCPQCTKFYCRECVTEFERQFLCSFCLQEKTKTNTTVSSNRFLQTSRSAILFITVFILTMYFFYSLMSYFATLEALFHQ